MPENRAWLPRAALVVGVVTFARVVALWFNRTDLFVDESQYWLWGQRLDLGYYSKPPLIAWLIRAVTDLAGSDAPFFVRLPAPFLHALTALVLGAVAARLHSARAAIWVAASYVTLPLAALGSLLISTDTVMAPFFAAAILLHQRAIASGRITDSVAAGVAAGLGFLAKYAGIYFLLGTMLAALFLPKARLRLRQWGAMLAAFLAVIAPNILWNLGHDLATVAHTLDNVGWVRQEAWWARLNPIGAVAFFLAQFAVAGPVLFSALLWAWLRPARPGLGPLIWLSAPIVAIVCTQAFLDKAYANWAVAAYFAGTILAVVQMLDRAPRLLPVSLAINGFVSLALPVLAVVAPFPEIGGKPVLERYLGRAELSRQIIETAQGNGVDTVVAVSRDILADLFHTGRDTGLKFRAPRPAGRPRNYYEQTFPLTAGHGPALMVGEDAPRCAGDAVATFRTQGGAYSGKNLRGWILPQGCAP
ncbi:dolichyl-phosphate-mannose-protein mannosyltransferase [Albidovulum inexpectatum]|uniref:Dolichyl-phosphate-mannose-protein mannosyltransferase n=1 Tax=Albidovulum inexpectatum TaxID=196587 RepID=A0A2S5JE94_9RHOB|nr:glycosyltransferase family 39 protein [Albidovulum inexpectatum]PPB79605.1 dolichyl-phosphate-mannose-protein mannosyltransferase [Albidovulum inexpectatum]